MTSEELAAIEERYKEVWPTAEKLLALILLVKDVPALAARIRQLEHNIDTAWKELERRQDDTVPSFTEKQREAMTKAVFDNDYSEINRLKAEGKWLKQRRRDDTTRIEATDQALDF
jgi:hypothetical protein